MKTVPKGALTMKKKLLSLITAVTLAVTSLFCGSVTAGAATTKFDIVKELKKTTIADDAKLDSSMCGYFASVSGGYTIFISGLDEKKAAEIAELTDTDEYDLSVTVVLDSGAGVGCENTIHTAYVVSENFAHDEAVKSAAFSKTGSKYKLTINVTNYIHKYLEEATKCAVSIRAVKKSDGSKTYYGGKKLYYAPFSTKDTSTSSVADLTISRISAKTYTGSAQKPTVTIKDGTYTLQKNRDYTVTYKNNVAVGKAVVTIKGKGSYKGTRKISFSIIPDTTKINKASASADQITVYFDEVKGVDEYHLYYSTNGGASYKEGASVKAGNAKISMYCPIGSTYLVKIRTSKTVDGKIYYSKYSKELLVTNAIAG